MNNKEIRNFFKVKESLDEFIAKLTSVVLLSFRQVSHPFIRKVFALQYPNAPASPTTVSTRLGKFCEELRINMIEEFLTLKQHMKFGVVLDEWTSARKRRYMSIMVIGHDKAFSLGLVRIEDRATAQHLLHLLRERLMLFHIDLDKHVASIISDGASVMKKIGLLIQPVHQQLCVAHCIQLAVVKTLYDTNAKKIENADDQSEVSAQSDFFDDEPQLKLDYHITIEKIRQTVSMFHRSPTKNDVLQKHANVDFGHDLQLLKDVETRWSSLCDMLMRFQKMAHSVSTAFEELGKNFDFTAIDYATLKQMTEVLRFVKFTVEKLSNDYITLHDCDNLMATLFEILSKQRSKLAESLTEALKTEYRKRRTIYTDCMFYFTKNSSNQEMHLLLETIPPTKFQLTEAFSKIASSMPAPVVEQELADNSFDEEEEMQCEEDFMKLLRQKTQKSFVKTTQLNQELLTLAEEMELFEKTGHKGPILNFVENSLNSIRPTSVQCERVFSSANLFCSRRRTRLDDKTLDSLVFCRYYFNAKHYDELVEFEEQCDDD